MEIRMLKLSEKKDPRLSSMDISSIYLGYFIVNGKVTYSTHVPIASKPDYVLLTLGNDDSICYLCHVEKYDYKGKGISFSPDEKDIMTYIPEIYGSEENVSWLLLDSMHKIPLDFLCGVCKDEKMIEFVKNRANNKLI